MLRGRYDDDISTEVGRWQGRVYAQVTDHGWLRRSWRNEGQIADGVYRSNHPDARTLVLWHQRGIKEVVSLRRSSGAVHEFEAEVCDSLGMRLRNVGLSARRAPNAYRLLQLLNIFDTLERPALLHCKSGADRTGLAAALWMIHVEGRPVEEARAGLSWQHWHVKWSDTGVLDRVLDAYAARVAKGPIAIREWIETEYDPSQL